MESPRRTSYKLWSARWALNPYSKWEAGAWTVGFLHPWCSFHVSTFRLWLVLDLWVSWMAPSTEAMNVIIKWSKSLKNYGGDTCNGRRRIRSGRDRSGYALHSLARVFTTWRWQANESHLVCQNIYASFALTLISLQFLLGLSAFGPRPKIWRALFMGSMNQKKSVKQVYDTFLRPPPAPPSAFGFGKPLTF